MYKIMLADDEGIVIDSLKFVIQKEFGDECEIEFAKTGRSVIELAERFRPDIAIMDIQMPGINGIDAMREIRRTNSSVVFIVMSAYDKFDYAREAIKLGVSEYITKPMDRTRIVNALRNAMSMVCEEREKRSNELIIREKLETVVPILESGLIYNILFHECYEDDIRSYRTMLDITEDHAFMMTLACGDTLEESHMTNAMGSGVRLQARYREIRSMLKDEYRCIVGTVMGNKIAVMIPYADDHMDYNARSEFIEKTRTLVHRMRKKTSCFFRIGIGKVRELTDMAESYSEALGALAMTTGSVAHADDLPLGCDYADDYPVHLEKKLFDEVSHGRLETAVTVAGEYYEWMKGHDMMDVRLKVLEFALRAESLAYENGGMTYRFESRQTYLPEIMGLSDMTALRDWFVAKISEACRNIMSKRRERSVSVVESAKEFIRANYSRNISLEDVSRKADISPYYFSRVFKEETGENFIDYLTDIRINKAKELLADSDRSMKEICSMVGYSDPNYFSRSFKKRVGVTPTEYKEGQGL